MSRKDELAKQLAAMQEQNDEIVKQETILDKIVATSIKSADKKSEEEKPSVEETSPEVIVIQKESGEGEKEKNEEDNSSKEPKPKKEAKTKAPKKEEPKPVRRKMKEKKTENINILCTPAAKENAMQLAEEFGYRSVNAFLNDLLENLTPEIVENIL